MKDSERDQGTGCGPDAVDPVEVAERIIRQRRESSAGVAPVLAVGQVVADRYRVERMLGAGGMGQVYEVEDLELRQRIALKTLHPRRVGTTAGADALKQELQVARRVAHPNVCRVYDLARIDTADGGSTLAVTMQLLCGPCLADVPVPATVARAVAMARQLAEALAAAHAMGVVHGDIKPENLILHPDRDGRLVVTDFGLAHQPEIAGEDRRFAGTPATIAPEALTGAEVGPPADVYAFGVVLYRLLTGTWPFEGPSPVATAIARLEGPPVRAARRTEGIPEWLDALVMRCLERDPARRPADGGALVEALGSDPGAFVPPRRRRVGLAAALVAGIAAIAFATGLFDASPPAGSPGPAAPAGAPGPDAAVRGTLAIAGFSTDDPEWEWVETALATRIAALVEARSALRVADLDESRPILVDLGAPDPEHERTAAILAERTGASWSLSGTFEVADDAAGTPSIHLRARLHGVDAAMAQSEFSGPLDDLRTVADAASAWAAGEMGVTPADDDAGAPGVPAVLAQSPEAAREHARGLRALEAQRPDEARVHFEAALDAAPGHPIVLIDLADALDRTGEAAAAQRAAAAAAAAVDGLDRVLQLEVRGRHAILSSDWEGAEETYTALFAFYPDELEYGLRLAEAQQRGSRFDAALQTVARLRELPEPAGSSPRIDLLEAWTRYQSGDYPGGAAAAQAAEAEARSRGRRSQVAEALYLRFKTTDRMADPGARTALLDEAAELYAAVGDERGLTEVLMSRGEIEFERGNLREAERVHREVVARAETTGDGRALARGLTNLAIDLDVQGRIDEGVPLKERALASYRERDIHMGAAITLENLGISLFKLGRMAESLQRFDEASREFARLGDQIGIAWAPYHQARSWRELGELRLARQQQEAARRNAEERPEGGLGPYSEYELMLIDIEDDRHEHAIAEARRLAELFDAEELAVDAAETRLVIAMIDNDQGRHARAAEMATVSLAAAVETGSSYLQAWANVELLYAAIARDDVGAAESACGEIERLVPALRYRVVALRSQIAAARCSALAGDLAVATASLARTAEDAAALGLVWPYVDATLERASLRHDAGDREAALALLEPLRARAEENDWPRTRRRIQQLVERIDRAGADPGTGTVRR